MGGSRDEEGDGHQSFRASIIRRIPPTWRRRLRWVLAQSALLGLNFAQNEWVSGVGWVELDKGLVGCLYDESIIVFVSTNRSNCYRYLNAWSGGARLLGNARGGSQKYRNFLCCEVMGNSSSVIRYYANMGVTLSKSWRSTLRRLGSISTRRLILFPQLYLFNILKMSFLKWFWCKDVGNLRALKRTLWFT